MPSARLATAVLVAAVAGVMLLSAVPVASADFGVHSFSFSASNRDGSPDLQAGSHPFELTASFRMNGPEVHTALNDPHELFNEQALKDTRVQLPPGLVGNPDATPRCSAQLFISGRYACPSDTAVGYETVDLLSLVESAEQDRVELLQASNPIYNIVPPRGVAAQFGFQVKGLAPVFLDVSVRTGGDYGLTVDTRNIVELFPVYDLTAHFWGVPADPAHDPVRGECLTEDTINHPISRGNCPVSAPRLPLLVNPTSCGAPRSASISVDSWQQPGVFLPPLQAAMPELSGCQNLDFSPSFVAAPQQSAGSTPTGLNVDLHVPQESFVNPDGLEEANAKNTTVVLPAGLDISPSAANGLLACSQAQLGLHNSEPATCPEASKIASVEVNTPALPEPLLGSAYLAQQGNLPGNGENPFGSLTALYIVAEDKQAGVLVKLAGEVKPDPVTGRLVTTFTETPQVPFSDFKLNFFGGPRAPLTTPAFCGVYTTRTTIEPWSGTVAVDPASSFQVTSGPGGSPCQDPLPFAPGFQAGTTDNQAGAFAPFTLTMTRPDGDQALGRTQVKTPPGLLGMLSSVKQCQEPQAAEGKCGPESLIGETTVDAGLGSEPVTVTGGQVYITGPYEGAPFGLSIVNPAVAGPFNLGPNGEPIVVRARIEVDPATGALTVTSDPLPTALQDIALQLQRIDVTINRHNFMFNPTTCEPLPLTGTLSSDGDAASVAVSSRFQSANCAQLPFKPKFTASTQGTTSKSNGASLVVKVSQAPGEANIHKVDVQLPLALPARLTTLQKACTQAQFAANPAGCPAGAFIGTATATTPVLDVPLSGPAILVSHGGAAFPDVEFVLQGEGVTIVLDGATDIKKGITYSRFETVPDAPISSFQTTLPEGPHSALAANGNLCQQNLAIPTLITGQNGAVLSQSTNVAVTGCPNTLTVLSHSVKGASVTLVVAVPSAGRLTATGKGLKSASKSARGRGTLRLTLETARHRKLKTKVKLTFTPARGRKLTAAVAARFKR